MKKITLTLFNWNNKRRPRIEDKVWIKISEILHYTLLVSGLANIQNDLKDVLGLGKGIIRLCDRGGFGFTFKYLKEAHRLTLKFLALTPEKTWISGVRVGRDSVGLPWLIPISLRIKLREGDMVMSKVVLTILSIYRVFPTSPKVSLGTITDPFIGITKTLPYIKQAVKELTANRLRLPEAQLILIESASPNNSLSSWNCGWDALAFIHYPSVFYSWVRYMLAMRLGENYVLWALFLFVTMSPLYLLGRLLKSIKRYEIGKLEVVYDQAGKARVIAICSYWLRLGFKPLHNVLFNLLKTLSCDGTSDQGKPLELLISSVLPGQIFYSYDLSAATDRLPIDLQGEILNILFRNDTGDRWVNLLKKIWWKYNNSHYLYSVGQPMGAYSSWAMLAVTHHTIVRSCALSIGKSNFTNYAILGDDIVIADDGVAAIYLATMKSLGVDINLSKSMVTPRFAEFAKTWRGKECDFTPVGPGLLLRTLRDSVFIPTLLAESYKLRLISSRDQLLNLIKDLKDPFIGLWVTLGPDVIEWEKGDDVSARSHVLSSITNRDNVIWGLEITVRSLVNRELLEYNRKLDEAREYFNLNWSILSFIKFEYFYQEFIEIFFRFCSPAYFIYYNALFVNSSEIDVLSWSNQSYKDGYDTIDVMLQRLDIPLSSTINWKSKSQTKEYSEKLSFISNCWFNKEKHSKISDNILNHLNRLF